MWSKPWGLKEGFLIVGGLMAVGLMLEASVGPIVWEAFAWPANAFVLAALVLSSVVIGLVASGRPTPSAVQRPPFATAQEQDTASHRLDGPDPGPDSPTPTSMVSSEKGGTGVTASYALRFLTSTQAAVPALVGTLVLTLIMGLTRQHTGGGGLGNMLAFWPFVLVYTYLALLLGGVTTKQALRFPHRKGWREASVLLSHAGLFIALTTGTLGNADMQRLKLVAVEGQPEWRAFSSLAPEQAAEGGPGSLAVSGIVELPFAIELQRFIMEQYDDGSPRQFASDLLLLTQKGLNIRATVSVNHPVEVEGWKIYQYGYDTLQGPDSQTSILELVRDPWLPAVYTGIIMMLLGALGLFLKDEKKKKGPASAC